EIASQTGADPAATEAALDALRRHDVVTAVDNGGSRQWRCTVELMRRWLGQRQRTKH
ncbi:MAG: hypothetical protein GY856_49485, partial [bacterium]|nr:hypothetical protein [bacterium]